jgi:hypothetical protein
VKYGLRRAVMGACPTGAHPAQHRKPLISNAFDPAHTPPGVRDTPDRVVTPPKIAVSPEKTRSTSPRGIAARGVEFFAGARRRRARPGSVPSRGRPPGWWGESISAGNGRRWGVSVGNSRRREWPVSGIGVWHGHGHRMTLPPRAASDSVGAPLIAIGRRCSHVAVTP